MSFIPLLCLSAPLSAHAETGLLVENDFVSGQCGPKVRTGGPVAFGDENGDGVVDNGGSYVLRDAYELLSILWLGISQEGERDCNSDLRRFLAENWKEQFLYYRTCLDIPCAAVHHLFRPGDDDEHVAAFLSALGTSLDAGEAFCNGNDQEDKDPIRRPCTEDEQVCGPDGTLGLVLPIVEASEETSAELCETGKFDWHDVPFAMRPACEDGAPSVFGYCLTPLDANGNAGCLNEADNYSMFTPLENDTRATNRVVRDANGAVVSDSSETDLTGAFYRLHTLTPETQTCTETDPMRQIGCLMTPSPCSQGCADERSLEMLSTAAMEVSLNLACPELTWFFIAPVTQGVGSYIGLESEAVDEDDDPLWYTWSVNQEGDFLENPHASYTTFYCERTGTFRLSLSVQDNRCGPEYTDIPVYCVE